jgi:hypothetical protein
MSLTLITAVLGKFTFRCESATQPFEGFIHPQKKLFFGVFRQLVYFLYAHRGG